MLTTPKKRLCEQSYFLHLFIIPHILIITSIKYYYRIYFRTMLFQTKNFQPLYINGLGNHDFESTRLMTYMCLIRVLTLGT
jgi:hypothetical protein